MFEQKKRDIYIVFVSVEVILKTQSSDCEGESLAAHCVVLKMSRGGIFGLIECAVFFSSGI